MIAVRMSQALTWPRHPPPNTDHSDHLWAPELHALRGRWYIYFAADDPKHGNKSHRMFVLGGPPESTDPHAGPWEFLGPIKGMDQRQWAIDGTVFELEGRLYFVYSGWPLDRPWDDYDEKIQQLFIIQLSDPVTAASAPSLISRADFAWEREGAVGINEGPQWLESPDDGRTWRGIVYSCGASWTKNYKMATLTYQGGNPLDRNSWMKGNKPLIQNASHGHGPFGPGHGNFLHLGNETVALFHATDRDTDGNQNRKARCQRVMWTNAGPYMGEVVGPHTRDMNAFLGGSQTGSLEREHHTHNVHQELDSGLHQTKQMFKDIGHAFKWNK